MLRSASVVTVALCVALCASGAAGEVVEVDGDRFRHAGLTAMGVGCFDATVRPTSEAEFQIRRGPGEAPLGTHAAGWLNHEVGVGRGAAGESSSPTTLSAFRIQVVTPGGVNQGAAVATYFPPDDDGYWIGHHTFAEDVESGWHAVNALNRFFTWRHYSVDGTYDGDAAPNPIAAHATAHGGDGEGVRLGFVFGCNGERFFVDRLQIASDHDRRVYDFGGFRTRAELRLGTRQPDKITITVGRRLDLTGRLFRKYVARRLAGRLQFQSKPLKGGSWTTFTRKQADRTDPAEASVEPLHNSAYRVAYPGTATRFEGAVSDVVKVVVRMRASASFADPTITRGDSYAAVGTVTPGKRAGVQLQRHVDGGWRTIGTATTSPSGDFRFGGTAQEVGTSYWRVRVDGGATNADNVSRTFKLTVSAPPPTDVGGGNDDPPPPPPEG